MNYSLRIDRYHLVLMFFLLLSVGYIFFVKLQDNADGELKVAPRSLVPQGSFDFFKSKPEVGGEQDTRPISEADLKNLEKKPEYQVTIPQGSSFYKTIMDLGINSGSAHLISSAVNKVYNISKIRAGESITIRVQSRDGQDAEISEHPEKMLLCFSDTKINVEFNKNFSKYNANIIPLQISSSNSFFEGDITGSFYANAHSMGISPSTIMEFIKLFSYDIDFQRDINADAKFKILYTSHLNEFEKKAKDDEIIYASLAAKGKEIEIYRHKVGGKYEYFHKDGSSIKKSLLRTPIKSARISSGFGMRKHPVLGYSRMHKGLDYAAPKGTPVLAAGDGVVEIATRHRSYGKYVKIKHNNKYSTLYAHLNGFHKIRSGKKVKQGQVIGYVGSTGMSTGPHLHYEVHVHGKQVNPAKVSTMKKMDTLSKSDMKSFQAQQTEVRKIIKEARVKDDTEAAANAANSNVIVDKID